MAPVGLIRLGQTLGEAIAGDGFPLLTPAIYIWVYSCFVVLGLAFAAAAWGTRNPAAPASSPPPRPQSTFRTTA
ncbi:MAG: hypothetical protein M3350_03015 [Actinomycetota bacterium]|nr:hypothetical protein [Actinomycetota bacterium]